MKYFFIEGSYIPRHCIYGPRPREAVFFDDSEWYNINDNLQRWNREKQTVEAFAAKEHNKKNMSYNMTKNWQNTLASIKTQSEQKRVEKKEKDKQNKIDEYNRILENRKEERKSVAVNARKMLFEERDESRILANAVVQCAVVAERKKQIELKNYLKQEKAKKDANYVGSMLKDVENFKKEGEESKRRKIQEKKNYRIILHQQIEEQRKRTEKAMREERKAAREDLLKMKESIDKMKECEEKEKQDGVRRNRMNYEKSYQRNELERNLAMEEEEENEVNRMINKYATRFAKERTQKEKSLIGEAIANREKVTRILVEKLESNDKKQVEANAEEEDREKEESDAKMKAEAEMLKWKEEHKARRAMEKKSEKEALKWAILQNERKREVDEAWAMANKMKKREEKERTREVYLRQMREKAAEEEEIRKAESAFLSGDDSAAEILKACDDAEEYVKAEGWATYPVKVATAKLRNEFPAEQEVKTPFQRPETDKRGRKPAGLLCYCFKN